MTDMMHQDVDPQETKEWIDALESVLEEEGVERAHYLLEKLIDKARRSGAHLPYDATTAYINTIPAAQEPKMPGDLTIEARIRAAIRWNALMIVLRASKKELELGGHIGSFASSAMLYDVGFNHFFKASNENQGGDFIFSQGHISPGIYARSFIEGNLTEEQLNNFRQECAGDGLSSYPHPHLMKDYWQFPTVSMGLGPLQAIYTARFLKYLTNRGIKDCSDQRVYCYMGDGECDEPESLGAIGLASREGLDNLTFVINCNLQRLDGPVRGNGKIIQELEGVFKGAGWNVIKVVWGRHWDSLLEKDKSGLLVKRMNEVCDGELQNYKYNGGAYTREHFFGKYPELLELVKDMTDDQIMALNRGGHDPYKVYAAYSEAMESSGKPTVILAQTVKGYGLGGAGEASNDTHSVKKLDLDSLKKFRDRFGIPVSDDELETVPYYRPAADSPELTYMKSRRDELGGPLPFRQADFEAMKAPPLSAFAKQLESSGDREISTTMAFVRVLSSLVKDKNIGDRVVPIVPDEARTFGMEGMFRQLGIYSSAGQQYVPHDHQQIMYYKEDKKGVILEEGINEAGAMSAWLALATAYSTSGCPMIPFYIFYSMFGFQRIGDLAWASGDSQARGFLIGATAGRTTLNGEGLQHQDGHSHILANTIPNCKSYDATFSYELAVIVQNGIKRMFEDKENCFYYLTTMNENYAQPAMPEGAEEGIIKGMYKFSSASDKSNDLKVTLMGAGTIFNEVIAAAEILKDKYQVDADIWSLTSVNELVREGQDIDRWNMLHPTKKAKTSYISQQLGDGVEPIVVATDYMKSYAEQMRKYVSQPFYVLGTDGFGRSDSREALRHFFEVDRYFLTISALKALADQGKIKASVVEKAIKDFGIDADKPNPLYQ